MRQSVESCPMIAGVIMRWVLGVAVQEVNEKLCVCHMHMHPGSRDSKMFFLHLGALHGKLRSSSCICNPILSQGANGLG